jgi:S1-C subfamily serine protease
MRIITLILALASLWFSQSKKPDEFFDKCLYPTVSIINKIEGKTGTGVIVKSSKLPNDNYINTVFSCEHIHNKKLIIQQYIYNEKEYVAGTKEYPAITTSVSKTNDISIIHFISKNKMKYAEIDYSKNNHLRDEVFSIGCGLGDYPRFTDGKINGLKPSRKELSDIRTNVCMVPGDSGGPLYNSKYKIFGIANSIRSIQSDKGGFPVTNISLFKSVNLFQTSFNNHKNKFVFEDSNHYPQIIIDYLYLSDAEYSR